MSQQRFWCFTIFTSDISVPPADAFCLVEKMHYIIWSLEKCSKTEKLHLQGYVEFSKQISMKQVKIKLGFSTIHVEPRKGTRDQARDYCMKSETHLEGPWELGKWESGGAGARTDLEGAALLLKEKGLNAVADAMPGTFVRYQKHLRDFGSYLDSRDSTVEREILCFWVHGPTNIGKSHMVYHSVEPEDLYPFCPGEGQNWFDCYLHQKVLLIDDLCDSKDLPASTMLHLADKWRYRVPIKGGFTWAHWNVVIVTSNFSMEHIYAGTHNIESIIRRFEKIHVLTREDCDAARKLIWKKCTAIWPEEHSEKVPDDDSPPPLKRQNAIVETMLELGNQQRKKIAKAMDDELDTIAQHLDKPAPVACTPPGSPNPIPLTQPLLNTILNQSMLQAIFRPPSPIFDFQKIDE